MSGCPFMSPLEGPLKYSLRSECPLVCPLMCPLVCTLVCPLMCPLMCPIVCPLMSPLVYPFESRFVTLSLASSSRMAIICESPREVGEGTEGLREDPKGTYEPGVDAGAGGLAVLDAGAG
jgi:hypothetical protein